MAKNDVKEVNNIDPEDVAEDNETIEDEGNGEIGMDDAISDVDPVSEKIIDEQGDDGNIEIPTPPILVDIKKVREHVIQTERIIHNILSNVTLTQRGREYFQSLLKRFESISRALAEDIENVMTEAASRRQAMNVDNISPEKGREVPIASDIDRDVFNEGFKFASSLYLKKRKSSTELLSSDSDRFMNKYFPIRYDNKYAESWKYGFKSGWDYSVSKDTIKNVGWWAE